MAEEKVENQKVSSQKEIDYAYAVIDSLAEALDKVATKPVLAKQFTVELMQKMPDFVDAFMILVAPEHREMMAKLIRSSTRAGAGWLKQVVVR